MTSLSSLPEKSKNLYKKTYVEFMSWCHEKQITCYSESVLLAYFSDVAERGLIGSLWPKYSMLKSTLNSKEDTDISKYNKLIKFIKKKIVGYAPKKSKVLEKEQVQKFIADAPDLQFLMMKVALIFGVAGAMRKEELLKLEMDDVQDLGSKFLITIRASNTKTSRIFTVVDTEQNNVLNLIKHYISLRPAHTPHKRFFIYYKKDKCSIQPIGINAFSKMPSTIASFLKLEHPHLYTGHCFRRSSASIRTDSGTDSSTTKRLDCWKFTDVANGCIENSATNKMILVEKNLTTSTVTTASSSTSGESNPNVHHISTSSGDIIKFGENEITINYRATNNSNMPVITFTNCSISNVNINLFKQNSDD